MQHTCLITNCENMNTREELTFVS